MVNRFMAYAVVFVTPIAVHGTPSTNFEEEKSAMISLVSRHALENFVKKDSTPPAACVDTVDSDHPMCTLGNLCSCEAVFQQFGCGTLTTPQGPVPVPSLCCATCQETPTPVPSPTPSLATEEYDYIVVGGGTSGCFAAKALAAKGRTLLLERGKPLTEHSNLFDQNSRTFWPKVLGTDAVKWLQTNSGIEAEGNALGGGSAVNAGVVLNPGADWFASAGLLDEAALQRAWDAVKSITSVPSVTNTLEQTVSDLMDAYLPDAERVDEVRSMFTADGRRNTAASILEPQPELLDIKTECTVDRLLFEGNTAVAVSYQQGGEVKEARLKDVATSRLFLAAGPFQSPAILMRSGIGDKELLERLGINVIVEDEKLGTFQERSSRQVMVAPSESFVEDQKQGAIAPDCVTPSDIRSFGGNSYQHQGFGLIPWSDPGTQPFFEASKRSLGCLRAQQSGFTYVGDAVLAAQTKFGLVAIPQNATYSGSVRINSVSPSSDPSIELERLDHMTRLSDEGLDKCLVMMKDASLDEYCAPFDDSSFEAEIAQTQRLVGDYAPLKSICGPLGLAESCLAVPENCTRHRDMSPVPDKEKDHALYKSKNDYDFPIWHACGGSSSVLDADYGVRGLHKLFVVDSSAAKTIPPVNPQATFMTLGYYVADVQSRPVPQLWPRLGAAGRRCMGQGFRNSAVRDRRACQDLAVSRGDAFFQYRPTMRQRPSTCATFAACDAPYASEAWDVYRNDALWPQISDVGFKCANKKKAKATADGQAACQAVAVSRGHTYYQYDPKRGGCGTTLRCEKPKMVGTQYRIFQSPTPAK